MRQQNPAVSRSQTSPCCHAVVLTLAIFEITLLVGMLLLWVLFMLLAVRTYRKLSYIDHRAANISESAILQISDAIIHIQQNAYMPKCRQADTLNPSAAHVLTQCMVVSVQTCGFRCRRLPCCQVSGRVAVCHLAMYRLRFDKRPPHCNEIMCVLVLQLGFLFWSMLFFISCVCLLFFVKLNSCSSFVETWLGFAPLYVRNHLLNRYHLRSGRVHVFVLLYS